MFHPFIQRMIYILSAVCATSCDITICLWCIWPRDHKSISLMGLCCLTHLFQHIFIWKIVENADLMHLKLFFLHCAFAVSIFQADSQHHKYMVLYVPEVPHCVLTTINLFFLLLLLVSPFCEPGAFSQTFSVKQAFYRDQTPFDKAHALTNNCHSQRRLHSQNSGVLLAPGSWLFYSQMFWHISLLKTSASH